MARHKRLYNELQKTDFLRGYSPIRSSSAVAAKIMHMISDVEYQHDVDFCMMDDAQAQEAFDAVSGAALKTEETAFSILRAYVKWCERQRIRTTDSWRRIKSGKIEAVRSQMVASPYHLLRSMNAVYPDAERYTSFYLYRSFLWLAFMGFDDVDAIQIRVPEVDFESMQICHLVGSSPHQIYAEAVPDLYMACTLQTLSGSGNSWHTEVQRASGDLLLRGKRDDAGNVLTSTFRPVLSRAVKRAEKFYSEDDNILPPGTNIKLSYDRLKTSGMYYRTYERERIGVPINTAKMYRYERALLQQTSPEDRYQGTRDWMYCRIQDNDYAVWKVAFAP